MIDEEEDDVENLLKRKISWKAILKGFFGLIMLGGAVLLIQFSRSEEGINYTYFFLAITLMCVASSIMVPIPERKKEVRHTISLLKCEKCGSLRVQDYMDGDFVYKDTETPCKQCSGNYKIHEVYSLKLKSTGKKKTIDQ